MALPCILVTSIWILALFSQPQIINPLIEGTMFYNSLLSGACQWLRRERCSIYSWEMKIKNRLSSGKVSVTEVDLLNWLIDFSCWDSQGSPAEITELSMTWVVSTRVHLLPLPFSVDPEDTRPKAIKGTCPLCLVLFWGISFVISAGRGTYYLPATAAWLIESALSWTSDNQEFT